MSREATTDTAGVTAKASTLLLLGIVSVLVVAPGGSFFSGGVSAASVKGELNSIY